MTFKGESGPFNLNGHKFYIDVYHDQVCVYIYNQVVGGYQKLVGPAKEEILSKYAAICPQELAEDSKQLVKLKLCKLREQLVTALETLEQLTELIN